MRKTMILALILLAGLSTFLTAKTSASQQLQDNLANWEQFRWEGIIQVQMSAFSARKNFILSKNRDEMRLDVLDSGVMGLQAKPIATIYLKDRILLEAPTIKQLQDIDLNWFVPQSAIGSFVHFTDSLQANLQSILKDRKLTTAATTYTFDKKHRLVRISSPEFGMKGDVVYNRRNQPTKLLLDHDGDRIVELQINKQKYGYISIKPLQSGPVLLDPDEIIESLPPEEGSFYELELNDINLSAILDSLDLSTLRTSLQAQGMNLDDILRNLPLNDIDLSKFLKQLYSDYVPKDTNLDSLEVSTLLDSLMMGSLITEEMKQKILSHVRLLNELGVPEDQIKQFVEGIINGKIKLEDVEESINNGWD